MGQGYSRGDAGSRAVQIGMVTQETANVNRSAVTNILYGRPDATQERGHCRLPEKPRRMSSSGYETPGGGRL